MTGPLALVGSGEYLPVMLEVERALLADRPPVYVQIPTAAAPEGAGSLARWVELGREQAARLGVQARPIVVRDRAEADDPDLVALVAGAGLIYLSGGSPPYLADSLRGSALWAAIEQAWRGGAALAGCSAGAIALSSWVPDLRHPVNPTREGLGVVPHLRVIPHFDRFLGWLPDLVGRYLVKTPEGTEVIGIDEDTALVWRDDHWQVQGRQSVWLLRREGRTAFTAGQRMDLPAPV